MSGIRKVIDILKQRFSAPLQPYHKRRIIFWEDENKEFTDQLEVIANSLDGVATVANLEQIGAFELKERMTVREKDTNFLVYSTAPIPAAEHDVLLPLRLLERDSGFRADLVSLWMEEMGLRSSDKDLRNAIEDYRIFFKREENRTALRKMVEKGGISAWRVPLTIIAIVCGCDNTDTPDNIVRALLRQGWENNELLERLWELNLEPILCHWVGQYYAFISGEERLNLQALAEHLLLAAAAHCTAARLFKEISGKFSMAQHELCFRFADSWLHDAHTDEAAIYRALAREVEETTGVRRLLERADRNILTRCAIFPCIDEILLAGLTGDIAKGGLPDEEIRDIISKRRSTPGYITYQAHYDTVGAVADMMLFAREHGDGFHETYANKLWTAYEQELYMMDSHYRRYHRHRRTIPRDGADLSEALAAMAPAVERLYAKHLTQLSRNWTAISAAPLAENGCLDGPARQENFYDRYVRGDRNRVVVIISDALRYEVAAELAQKLRQEIRGEHRLSGEQGIFPTETKYGMAALLPHSSLTLEETGDGVRVLVDGKRSDSGYRQGLLQAAKAESVALRYDDLGKTRNERKAKMRGPVVYIYHNTIDICSHSNEKGVFEACERAISELGALVRMLASDQVAYRIIVTADHGFLYTDEPLVEADKAAHDFEAEDVVDGDRRHIITRKEQEAGDMLPICLLRGQTSYHAYTPRELIRLKLQGAGQNFVHGGASLQEMMVPVIEVLPKRKDDKKREKYEMTPTDLMPLVMNPRLTSKSFTLRFLQTAPVGERVSAETFTLYFIGENNQRISNIQKIVADKENEDDTERVFLVDFELLEGDYSKIKTCHLLITGERGTSNHVLFDVNIQTYIQGNDFF